MANNNWRKLIRGFCLLVVGCVLIAIGMSLGGHWMAPRWWPFDGHSIKLEWDADGKTRDGVAIVEREGAIPSAVSSLRVDLKAASLEIERGPAASYRVTGFEEGGIDVTIDGTEARFEERNFRHTIEIGSDLRRPRVVIVVPEGTRLDRCAVSMGAGTVSVDGLDARELAISSGAGAVRGTGIDAETLNAETGAGNVEFERSRFGEAEVKTAAGRVAIQASLGERTRIATGAGTIELTLPGTVDDWRFEFERGVGVVRIGNETFTGIGNGTAGNLRAAKLVSIESGVGAVHVDFGE